MASIVLFEDLGRPAKSELDFIEREAAEEHRREQEELERQQREGEYEEIFQDVEFTPLERVFGD
jgi:hypothetical protein